MTRRPGTGGPETGSGEPSNHPGWGAGLPLAIGSTAERAQAFLPVSRLAGHTIGTRCLWLREIRGQVSDEGASRIPVSTVQAWVVAQLSSGLMICCAGLTAHALQATRKPRWHRFPGSQCTLGVAAISGATGLDPRVPGSATSPAEGRTLSVRRGTCRHPEG